MREISAAKAYARGGTIVVTTADQPRANIMTMGFHMMVQHDTPLIGCVIGPWDDSYAALRKTRECVISVPSGLQVDLASETRFSGDRNARRVPGADIDVAYPRASALIFQLFVLRTPEHRRTRRMSDSCGSPDQLTGILMSSIQSS